MRQLVISSGYIFKQYSNHEWKFVKRYRASKMTMCYSRLILLTQRVRISHTRFYDL